MFNHLEAPTSGEVIIDGDHIGQLSKNGLRAKRQKVLSSNILICYGQGLC